MEHTIRKDRSRDEEDRQKTSKSSASRAQAEAPGSSVHAAEGEHISCCGRLISQARICRKVITAYWRGDAKNKERCSASAWASRSKKSCWRASPCEAEARPQYCREHGQGCRPSKARTPASQRCRDEEQRCRQRLCSRPGHWTQAMACLCKTMRSTARLQYQAYLPQAFFVIFASVANEHLHIVP